MIDKSGRDFSTPRPPVCDGHAIGFLPVLQEGGRRQGQGVLVLLGDDGRIGVEAGPQEFVRVGYYQNTEYDNEEMKEAQPKPIVFERLVRDISTKPRVTRFQIKWCV